MENIPSQPFREEGHLQAFLTDIRKLKNLALLLGSPRRPISVVRVRHKHPGAHRIVS